MFAAQKFAKVAPRMASTAVQQVRNNHIISKPRNRVSFVEKIAHGLFICVGALTIPLIIATNFNKWREARGEE